METPFTIERTYSAPVALVWQAITNKDDMKKWYFDLAEFRAEPGFEFEFAGRGSDNVTEYVHHCRVTEVKPMQKLTYSWTYKGMPGESFVTFELFDEGNGTTRLKLTHSGLESFAAANSPDFARKSFEQGWTMIIGTALKNYLEQGS